MDLSNFNWSEHDEDGGFPVVPPGDYLVAIRSFKRVQRGRDTHIDFQVAILTAVQSNELEPGEEVRGSCYETVVLADRGIWRVAEIFRALDAPTTVNLNSDREIAKAVKGKPFLASVIQNEWQGKTRNKIDHALRMSPQAKELVPVAEESFQARTPSTWTASPGEPDMADRAGSNDRETFSEDDVPF